MYNHWGHRIDTGLCGLLWSIGLNCQLMTKLEMMHILQAQVCRCISAHLWLLPTSKKETWNWRCIKSQLNQASWNINVLKIWLRNLIRVHNYLSILFRDFLFIARCGKSHVINSLMECAPHTYSKGSWYWRMLELLAFEYVKLMLTKKQVSKIEIHPACRAEFTNGL